jgi:adenylate cyclase
VLVIWLLLTLTPMWSGIAMSAALCGGYMFYAQRVFETDNRVLLVVPVVSAAIAALGACVVVLATSAIRERRHITGLFSRYVSPEVVRELVDVHEGIKLGGERREVSLLFSDIRGFTTMSEGLDPAELVAHLNEYFEEMVEAVELERGTLDKFIGDGLMAIFGAPLPQEDHADRACATALDMVERLRRFNERRKEQGLSQLEIGIGIHTGEAIIGNIGSPSRRVDYTAIGDTVNLASRMESSTKELGCQILVSKETATAASEHMFRSHGEITVKGRTAATKVFELTGGGNAANGATDGSSFDVGGDSPAASVDAA